jgi:anaerobic magnesium-protoporphyrin IX monomethyl ester cyclase
MQVLLVQSYLGADGDVPVYPLGLAYVATAAQNCGHTVRIADLNVMSRSSADLARLLADLQPDCIGVSLRNIDNQSRVRPVCYYERFRQLVGDLRRQRPDTPIVAGGAGFSMFAKRIMAQNPAIDFGVCLEAEESFPMLLEHLSNPGRVRGVFYRRDGAAVFSGDGPPPDFAALPAPRRDFLDLAPYRRIPFSMGIQTKRGCPLRCAYCNYPHLNGAAYRLRDPAQIVDELENLAGQHGFREVSFTDSVLNLPNGHSEAIFQEILRRNLRVSWNAYMHLRGVDKEYAHLALRAGCVSMLFSPDGISQPALDGLCKDLSASDVQRLAGLFGRELEFGPLHVGFCYFISPPGETLIGLLKALWFYVCIHLSRLRRGTARMRAYVGWIRLEPDTMVRRIAIAEGSLREEDDLLPDTASTLRRMFYRHPRLHRFDAILLLALRIIHVAERAVRRMAGRGRPL